MHLPISIVQAVAEANRQDRLRIAETYRRAGDARTNDTRGPSAARLLLTRARMRVRPILPSDGPGLTALLEGLSPQSRLARYLAPKRSLSQAELRYLTNVDHHHHEALVAVTRLRHRVVGVARFVRDSDEPATADVAAEVLDAVQGQGVGKLLTGRLAERARAEGVAAFTALTMHGNIRARRLLAGIGRVDVVQRTHGTTGYRVTLHGDSLGRKPRVFSRSQLGPVDNYVSR